MPQWTSYSDSIGKEKVHWGISYLYTYGLAKPYIYSLAALPHRYASSIVMAAMASTIGTALGSTQGS